MSKEPKRIVVREISSAGGASLVEWQEGETLRRALIPTELIIWEVGGTGATEPATLEAGIPYGDKFEDILKPGKVTPGMIANALRKEGIWTIGDLWTQSSRLPAILQSVYQYDMAAILMAVSTYQNSNQEVVDGR